MAEVQPDPTDTGTLRPKSRPLEQKGDTFILIDILEFDSHMILPSHITPLDALSIFSQFLPDRILDIIVENTNKLEGRAPTALQQNARAHDWVPLTRPELKAYLGIIIYQGLHIERNLKDYWSQSPDTPFHPITQYMSLRRFQILHRKFRI